MTRTHLIMTVIIFKNLFTVSLTIILFTIDTHFFTLATYLIGQPFSFEEFGDQ
jgi:hypothetical protein